jgi:Ca2+-binding EF-hand superfamily protein
MRVFLSALALVVMATADVSAESPRKTKFRQLDANRDGKLTRSEFSGHPGNFRAMDCDDDRLVTEAEYVDPYKCDESLDPNSPEGRFQAKDTSNDGVLSRREWVGEDVSFQTVDGNDDGLVSLREYLNQPRADQRAGHPDEPFDDLDHDRDGRLSRDEWHADRESFERMDSNGDGVISSREFEPGGAVERRNTRFRDLDRDRDGRIEWTEWDGDEEAFRVLDVNGDDVVSRSEFSSTRALSRRFRRLDDDRTGDLSRLEWPGDRNRFARLDRNGDGLVSRPEYLYYW